MDNLKRMVIFYHVVNSHSFIGAARFLGIARSAVSRQISILEKNIGTRLLNRTTRHLSMTEVGENYYQSCARIVEEAEMANRVVSHLQEEPMGTLKIAGPTSLGSNLVIAPMVANFIQKYPALNIELLLNDQIIDMVKDGIDVSIREGWLPDSNLIAKKLCDTPLMLCASPEYLERNGRPKTPSELSSHECVIFSLSPTPYHWTFTKNNKQERILVKGRIKTNNTNAVLSYVLAGAGISSMTNYMVLDDINTGRLVHLLPDYKCSSAGIYAVYQDRQYQQAKVRLFIDFMDNQLNHLMGSLHKKTGSDSSE